MRVSIEELVARCAKEIQFWEWVQQVRTGNDFHGFFQYLTQGPREISSILQSQDTPQRKQERIAGAFQMYYCGRQSIHSSHPKVSTILKLKEQDPVAAMTMLAVSTPFFNKRQHQISFTADRFSSIVRGIVENALFEAELKGAAESQSEALAKLRQEFKDQIHHQSELVRTFEALIATSKTTSEAAVTEQTEKLKTFHESSTNQFGELINTAKGDLEAYIESVKKRWALSESVSYWEEKEKYHKKRAFWFGIAWPSVGVALAFGVFELAWWLSGGLKPLSVVQGAPGQAQPAVAQPNYWHVAVLVISITLSIWFLRILVRVFLSHLHRHSDAHERITLIKTYLALLQEGKEIVPDDRKIIIQTIFRPSASGIVKEDAAPASPWEFLSRKS